MDGCATAPPGSPLLRAFLNNGCRSYIGSSAIVYGMNPARYANQLVHHFLDAYRTQPRRTMPELLALAKAKYAEVNRLGPLLDALERGEKPPLEDRDAVHLAGYLGWGAYGSPCARLRQSEPAPVYEAAPLFQKPARFQPPGGAVQAEFQLRRGRRPILYLQADWTLSASEQIRVRIAQNGAALCDMRGDSVTVYQHLDDRCVGGYADGGIYRARWLLPLRSETGRNRLQITLRLPEGEAEIRTETAVQQWPPWETTEPPADV